MLKMVQKQQRAVEMKREKNGKQENEVKKHLEQKKNNNDSCFIFHCLLF